MEKTILKNGMIRFTRENVVVMCNKEPKITGKKNMFQLLQGSHGVPSAICDDVKYIPQNIEQFIENINQSCSLHFGAVIA